MIKRLIIGQIIEGNEQRSLSSSVHLALLTIFITNFNIGQNKALFHNCVIFYIVL